ncbi:MULTISPECIES: transcriptional regulator [Rahnella]|uniref:Transcriptional regulator n=1 Tax=Rahnella laticis TaxID=2787622 RepID=A0ABS0E4G9_9GAMM|nr:MULTISPECIES: transcriptional regulator [Rahnella]KAB8309910.1 transcriptional regulator [Rouxiella chamberiensis]MBF7999126.1 transcriptional regulator [Rahnella sp. LAC-M12]MBU9822330.1 transcriptional regulator [Rahnella sp. BCC 1045]MDF1896989.1 transcriptional regulator [Rahnella contaminans]MBF7979609.1 transcriptional regulator [Rahnella laticis]
MLREQVLDQTLNLLEQRGLATLSLENVAELVDVPLNELRRFWPDAEALLYDSLRYHGEQIEIWRRQLMLDETLTPPQKLLARYKVLDEQVRQQRYPGCLFIAACTFFPESDAPIHQLAENQKRASYDYTLSLLQEMGSDDAEMVAQQMELILEGCLSKLLVKRQLIDVEVARRLAEDVLNVARCREHGALS